MTIQDGVTPLGQAICAPARVRGINIMERNLTMNNLDHENGT